MEVMAMLKALLLSTGVVSVAVMFKLLLPVVLDLLTTSEIITLSWLSPPYLYLIINCIIISIVASSKLQPSAAEAAEKMDFGDVAAESAVEERETGNGGGVGEVVADEEVIKEVVFGYVEESDLVKDNEEVREEDVAVVDESGVEEREEFVSGGGVEEEPLVLKPMWTLPEDVAGKSTVEVQEKPPVSARFGRRRAAKASPEGKAVLKRVSRPKRQETLESTWRTLTEGRPMPLTRHLRKSDTFAGTPDASPPVRLMKKSDTFPTAAVAASSSPGSGGKLRRESWMSQDELNRRVEAFIKKFNEEMRLQRQESLNQYREMVDRY